MIRTQQQLFCWNQLSEYTVWKGFFCYTVMIDIFYGIYVSTFWLFIRGIKYREQNEIIHSTIKMYTWFPTFSRGKYNGYIYKSV
jgi:hypothetical protein